MLGDCVVKFRTAAWEVRKNRQPQNTREKRKSGGSLEISGSEFWFWHFRVRGQTHRNLVRQTSKSNRQTRQQSPAWFA